RMLLELPPPVVACPLPVKRVAELDPIKPTNDPLGLPGGCQALRPLGVVPPELGRDLEFFTRGSSVELWDLKERRRVWSRAHPGAYLGVLYADPAPDTSGVLVMAVRPGSPAEKAGIQREDLLLTLDGRAVTPSGLGDLLAELAAGVSVELALRRPTTPQKTAWEDRKLRIELGAHPADHRPAIVGASFTQAYELAVAWEDGVSCLDLATGRVEWTFRDIRERFHVRAFHATEGRLYLYEAHRPERDRDVFRAHSELSRNERAIFRPEDAHHRLLCLSDLTGELAWARAFDFDPNNTNQDTQVFFYDRYLSDHVQFLQGLSRPGSRDWILWSIPSSTGVDPYRKNLMGQVLAHAADLERGVLYYVSDVNNDRKDRSLYSVSMDPARKEFKAIELPLNAKLMPPTHFACSLAANGERICLLVSPPQAGGEPQLWSVNLEGKDERKIPLPEGRTLPVGHPTGSLLDPNGLLYVYNIPREKVAPSRAFLTAVRVAAKDPGEMIVWDAVAPVVANTPAGTWQVISEPRGAAVFTAARAAIPGQSGETPVAVVYDHAEGGYIRAVHADLVVTGDSWGIPGPPASWWRGRLYVSAKQGLEIFGD
ncbi:MAG TPA: PDZ domain-containing protein, partial [Planctomycetota bacterium]|nr:PDZ domain-containing protein [Planctomycetota bacterium]